MAVPDIILPNPYVLIEENGSVLGGFSQGGNIAFGSIALINQTTQTVYQQYDYIAYINKDAIQISYDNVSYYIIKEDQILYKENYYPS